MASAEHPKDYSPLKRYEDLKKKDQSLQSEIEKLEETVRYQKKKLQKFDIQIHEEPDPKFDAVTRL